MTSMSDDQNWERLMGLAQQGDKVAYRRLLEDITPYLRGLARNHHRDHRDVEDSVQDILLTIHTIRHTYDPDRPFKPWLVAVGRRRIIDRLRVQSRLRKGESALIADAACESETFIIPQANLYEARSEERSVHDAINLLPLGQREAVTLLKIKELSLKEASVVSGMSIAALKTSTHRGLKALKRILAGEESKE